MDTDIKEKFKANRYRKHQVVSTLSFYSLVALVCTLFCSSPLWFAPVSSSLKAFLFLSLPKFFSLLLSSKVLFIVGNLIVIVLVRESKIHTAVKVNDPSPARDVSGNECVREGDYEGPQNLTVSEEEERELEKSVVETVGTCNDGEEAEEEGESEPEELEEINRRADAYIARVTKEMKLEAELILCSSK